MVPRQLLLIAKIYPTADAKLDALATNLHKATDLYRLIDPTLSGRGLLHWACWYDPWLMGCDVEPDSWRLELSTHKIAEGLWTLSLTDDWSGVESALREEHQYQEQDWLPWQLWQAYSAFDQDNHRAKLFYGRAVLGGNLCDDEIRGQREPS